MSKELLSLIKKYKLLYFFTLILGITITFCLYLHIPIKYCATASFKYIDPNGVSKITKIDKNGIITYEKFEPGQGGLDFTNFEKDNNVELNYISQNGTYIVKNISFSPEYSINQVNNFLDLIIIKNLDFLKEKLEYSTSHEEKMKLENLIKYPEKSFLQVVRSSKTTIINHNYIILFLGSILSFFSALTIIILKKRVDEI